MFNYETSHFYIKHSNSSNDTTSSVLYVHCSYNVSVFITGNCIINKLWFNYNAHVIADKLYAITTGLHNIMCTYRYILC